MPVTLSDVAAKAGVSIATVSRVLNNKMAMPIPDSTIQKIRNAAEELGYRPNRLARALATGRTHTFGLYSQELTDPHFAQMLEAAESRAASLGYQLIVSTSLASLTDDGRTDGTILLSSPALVKGRFTESRSVVYVDQCTDPVPDLIGWDDSEGAALAVDHLVQLGHRQIAGVWCYGKRALLDEAPKVQGFRDAVRFAGVESYECWAGSGSGAYHFADQFEDGYRAVWSMLDKSVPFTGLVARNDFIATGALRALREAGLRVPQDVSVVGYTDSIQAVCADPGLTSVRTPIAEAGERAVERLARAVEFPDEPFEGMVLKTELIPRDSTGPAPSAPASVVRTRAGYLTTREVQQSIIR